MTTTEKPIPMKQHELAERMYPYLKPYGWKKVDIGTGLMLFEDIHGAEKREAMNRFIDWAEENNRTPAWIAAQLGHDILGAAKDCFFPRTARY